MRFRFITQIKIEILLPFTGCSKVLEKMPGIYCFATHIPGTVLDWAKIIIALQFRTKYL